MIRQCGRALLLVVFLGAATIAWLVTRMPEPSVPSLHAVRAAYRPSDIQLLDRHGEVLHEMRTDPTRRRLAWTDLRDISPALQRAVIASEDRRFYRHGGVDGKALLAAAFQKITGGPRRGASTISMQLAALLSGGRSQNGATGTFWRKWRQMRLAWAVERSWPKAEILEAYLNLATFRGEVQGIRAAAGVLFGRLPHGLTQAEATVLAALLRSPNAPLEAVKRRGLALATAMGGTPTGEELAAALATALEAPAGTGPRVHLAPHAARLLLQPVRASAHGLTAVGSTLDRPLQHRAIETVRRHLLAAYDRHVRDGAVLVVDNPSGEVLAYVASSGDLATAPHVDGIRARRQAGSSLKPFLYGLALEQRLLTPASLVEDTPLDVVVPGGLYRPKNYHEGFRGLMSLRAALAGSVNVPAVRTLQVVGVELFSEQLRRLGFTGLTEDGEYYGLALALGSAEVSLWELVNAYRVLANDGVWSPIRLTEATHHESPVRRVYSRQTAFLVSHILADRESRSGTFGLENPLATRFWSAVKTGTSKEMRDNWCVGYSRRYTVGVWVGNFSGEPMRDVSGVTGAAPIWLELMAWLHRETPSPPPSPPAGVRARTVSFPRQIEPDRVEWFRQGTEPEGTTQALGPVHARILAPVHGTVIGLDPDIPPSRQRIVFEAQGTGAAIRWVLDGSDLGPANDLVSWQPRPGGHTLSLLDDGGNTLDTATFEVRGSVGRDN